MIFLVLVAIIAVIVIALNMYDNSNINMIKEHLEKQGCEKIIYSKGVYKALCEKDLTQIPNSFSVDLQKDKSNIKYSKINNIKKNKKTITINDSYKIDFKEEKNLEDFYKSLEEKIDK